MSTRRDFSNEDLTAYLDQEADADLVRALEAALESDLDLANRLESLRFPKDILAAAFNDQLAAAPPMPELPPARIEIPQAANEPTAPRWMGFFTGGATGLVAGIAAAFIFGVNTNTVEQTQPGWLEIVANYQMLYVPETLDPAQTTQVSGTAADQLAALETLSTAVAVDLTTLENVPGLTFRRAQRLGFRGKTLIQIAYSLPDGTPVAICILPSESQQKAPRSQALAGMAAADWTTGTHGVLIIGGENQAVIDDLAERVQPLI